MSAPNDLQPYLDMLERLRQEPFNVATTAKLEHHPFVQAAENGTLTLAQRRAFVCEQLAIQQSDATSFAHLAGNVGFCPPSLIQATMPDPISSKVEDDSTGSTGVPNLFYFLLGGELYASKLLLEHAKSLGLETEEAIQAHASRSAVAQAYPSYWARLALQGQAGPAAAACAVNFPAWGDMCRKLHASLASNGELYGYSLGKDDPGLAFIDFFAAPIDNLDEMAASIMKQENIVSYQDLLEPVRLLQEYEILFWDAVYEAK
jgi:thiaminase